MKKLLYLSLILYNSCCKEKTSEDPRKVTPKTSADFVCEIQMGNRWIEVDMADNYVTLWRFRAKDSTADEYLWKVGEDTFRTKSFTLSGFPDKRTIPITLTVKRYNPNTQCFPDDKGTETKTKSIYSENIANFQYSYLNKTTPINTTIKSLNGK